MKIFQKYAGILGVILLFPILTGYAAGSATAGYALKAWEADRLSAEGEQRVTERVKREIRSEFFERRIPDVYELE